MTATNVPSPGTPSAATQTTLTQASDVASSQPTAVPSGREREQRETLFKRVEPVLAKLTSEKLLTQESVAFITDKVRSGETDRSKISCQINEGEVSRFDASVRSIKSLPQASGFTEAEIQEGINKALKQAGLWNVIRAVENKTFLDKFCKKETPQTSPQQGTPSTKGTEGSERATQPRDTQPQGSSSPRSADPSSKRVAEIVRELRIPQSIITQKNSPLVLESKPDQLVNTIWRDSAGIIQLERQTAAEFSRMQQEAKRQGVQLTVLSGFRSISDQADIVRAKMNQGQKPDQIFSVSSVPGYSEHHSGKAIDVGSGRDSSTNMQVSFADTAEGKWLKANAGRFGFKLSYGDRDPNKNPGKYSFEPWHIVYTGK